MELTVTNRSQAYPKEGLGTDGRIESFVCGFEGYVIPLFLDSSMVEHSAVNRRVVGSSPTRGVDFYEYMLY